MHNKITKTDQFEIQFTEGILEKNPDFIQGLILLGELYTKVGLYEKGLNMDLRLARLRPTDPVILYNLACSYSLLGQIDQSFTILKQAIEYGFDNFYLLETDDDLANLKKDLHFQQYYHQFKDKKPSWDFKRS